DNAIVSGHAVVIDEAWVSGNAHVSGSAWICGNVRIGGDLSISSGMLDVHDGVFMTQSQLDEYLKYHRHRMLKGLARR
ncbi:MAG: hypothetical protein QW696_00775, partial [Candidatus Micrarchaeaceae archaeon]